MGGAHANSGELIKLLHSSHSSKQQTERFWSELRAKQRRKDESLQDLCQDIRRLMCLVSPHETAPLAERISIDYFVAALVDPIMRIHVMSKDLTMLEDTLTYSIRYKALRQDIEEHAPHRTQTGVLDPASYVYDDKRRKKRV